MAYHVAGCAFRVAARHGMQDVQQDVAGARRGTTRLQLLFQFRDFLERLVVFGSHDPKRRHPVGVILALLIMKLQELAQFPPPALLCIAQFLFGRRSTGGEKRCL